MKDLNQLAASIVSEATAEATSRWFCRRCGIVRDVPHGPSYPGIPFCHRNAPDVKAERMVPIPSGHPLATGPLPW